MNTWRWLLVMLLACGPLGCALDEEPPASQAADARVVEVLFGELGGSYQLSVVTKPAGIEANGDHVKLMRFGVAAGQSFAVVMRAHGDALDPYLALYPPDDKVAVAVSDWDQAVAPMAAERDAVVIHRAERDGDFLAFAADVDLRGHGSFQLDIVPLHSATSLDLTLTDPALRKLADELRQREPTLLGYVASGALSEPGDGSVVAQPSAVALKDRPALIGFAATVNDLRSQLFGFFVEANTGARDETLMAEVGATCGALWPALQGPHALR